MADIEEKYDALGKRIYSVDSNGVTTTGIVKNFTKSGVTLEVVSILSGLWSDRPEEKEFKEGQIFVEASPFDRIWGIGYDADHAMENIDNWGGGESSWQNPNGVVGRTIRLTITKEVSCNLC